LTPQAAAAALKLQVGAIVPAPTSAFLDGYRQATTLWAKNENRWVERLSRAAPLASPYLERSPTTPGAAREASVCPVTNVANLPVGTERPGDVLLAVVALLLVRLAPAASGALAFRHPELGRAPGAASSLFASHVPLPISVPDASGFAPWLEEFLETLDLTVK